MSMLNRRQISDFKQLLVCEVSYFLRDGLIFENRRELASTAVLCTQMNEILCKAIQGNF